MTYISDIILFIKEKYGHNIILSKDIYYDECSVIYECDCGLLFELEVGNYGDTCREDFFFRHPPDLRWKRSIAYSVPTCEETSMDKALR